MVPQWYLIMQRGEVHSRVWTRRFCHTLDLATMLIVQLCLRLQLAKLGVQTLQCFKLQAFVACAVISRARPGSAHV